MIGRCHLYIATAAGSLLHTPWYKPWLKPEINDAFSGQCLSTTIQFSWAISITLACNKPISQHSRDQCLIWAYSSNWQLSACQPRLFPNLFALPCRYGCARDWLSVFMSTQFIAASPESTAAVMIPQFKFRLADHTNSNSYQSEIMPGRSCIIHQRQLQLPCSDCVAVYCQPHSVTTLCPGLFVDHMRQWTCGGGY